jgi:hypothetical protein
MNLTAAEVVAVRALGLFLIEKCNGCGKALNQTFRYTIAGRPEVFCSALCRDNTFFADRLEARKHSTPGRCAYCKGSLKGKRRGALYCDETCKKRAARAGRAESAAGPKLTGTPIQSNQLVASPKMAEQGNRIAGGPQALESPARGEEA